MKHLTVAVEWDVWGRSLTGAWIETPPYLPHLGLGDVAPLRGRGLKQEPRSGPHYRGMSLPYGGVD